MLYIRLCKLLSNNSPYCSRLPKPAWVLCCVHTYDCHRTFPSGVLFSTQISSDGLSAGAPDAGTGGIPGGNNIPGGGGRFPMGGGRNGGLCSKRNRSSIEFSACKGVVTYRFINSSHRALIVLFCLVQRLTGVTNTNKALIWVDFFADLAVALINIHLYIFNCTVYCCLSIACPQFHWLRI